MAVAADACNDIDCLINTEKSAIARVTQLRAIMDLHTRLESFASQRNQIKPRLLRIRKRPTLRLHVARRPSLVYEEKGLLFVIPGGASDLFWLSDSFFGRSTGVMGFLERMTTM